MDSFDAQDDLDIKEWKSFINDPDYIDSIVYEKDRDVEYNKYRGFKLANYCVNKYSYNFTQDFIDDPQIDKDYLNSLLQTDTDLESSEKKKHFLDQIDENFLQRFSKSDIKITRYLSLKSQVAESQQPILKLEELSQISSKVYTPVQNYYNSPTAISISKQYIIIGNTQGLLTVFNHEGKDIKQLVPDEQNSAQVTAIDISDDEQHAIAGYSNGYVGLWELKSGDCLKFTGTSHKSQILTIKFWKKGKLNAISCDAAGKINLIEFMKLFIATTINTRTMINGDLGVCTNIKILIPNVYIPHPTDAANVIAMTFLDKVMIFTIEPEFKLVYSIEKPGWIFPEDLPYVAWKLGLCPYDNHIKGPVLAVAWGKLVALYRVNALNKNEIEIAGSMKLDDCANGIMWLSYDTLAVLSEENVWVLNSKEFNFIEDRVIEQETKLKSGLLNQQFIKNSEAMPISTYHNSCEAFDNAFYFLGEKGLFKGVLLDWMQVIENLKEKGEWLQVLSLCLEIYEGKRKKLFNLPFSKSDLKPYLEKVIAEYIQLNFINYESKVKNSIEYCIVLESLECLFDIFSGLDQPEYFYDIVGKYVLAQEIKAIPKEVLPENYDPIDRKFIKPQDDAILKRNSRLILKLLKNCGLDSENEIKQVFNISLKSPYDKIIAFLYELKRDFSYCLSIYLRSNSGNVRAHVFKWISQALKTLTEDELKDFKSAIFDNLYRLVQIDSIKTAKLAKELFLDEEIKLIQNLEKSPELQLKYLDGLVKLSQKEDLDPTHILKKYISLMCKFNPEEVLLALKSRNDYPIDECLEICRQFNVLNASAYLYEELGAIRESFDILLEFIQEKKQFLFEIMRKKGKIPVLYFIDLKKSIEDTLNLCTRNTDRLDKIDNEEHWFMLLKESLDIYANFQDYFVLYPSFEPEIKDVVKEIVEKMSDSIPFSSILSYIIENYSNIPIKYFKEAIIGVLSRLAYQKNIIRLAIDLQNRDTVQMSYKLLKLKNQGISSKDFNCAKCELPIQSDEMMKGSEEKFLLFICGHAYHGKCIEKPMCEKCDRDDYRKRDFNSKYSNKN